MRLAGLAKASGLAFSYDNLWSNGSSTVSAFGNCFPLTARRLRPGLIEGNERTITRVNGSFARPLLPLTMQVPPAAPQDTGRKARVNIYL